MQNNVIVNIQQAVFDISGHCKSFFGFDSILFYLCFDLIEAILSW